LGIEKQDVMATLFCGGSNFEDMDEDDGRNSMIVSFLVGEGEKRGMKEQTSDEIL
jgi:hypothetical protein